MDNDYIIPKQLAAELMPEWSTDKWLEWPPDIFALTSILLKTTGIYRYVVTPHPGEKKRLLCASTRAVRDKKSLKILSDWYRWIVGINDKPPALLKKYMKQLFDDECKLSFDAPPPYELCDNLLHLHTLADAAGMGFGMLTGSTLGRMCAVYFMANFLLGVSGTLSRLPSRHGVVLPKMRTPQRGITTRSLSHHLTFHNSEVAVRWQSIPWIDPNEGEKTLNILAIPFPYKVDHQSFRSVEYYDKDDETKQFRYFDYAPTEAFRCEQVISLLKEAQREVDRIDIIVFPELALNEKDLQGLQSALEATEYRHQMPMIITGIRGKYANKVRLSVYFAGKWYNLGQDKHHRWKLDAGQIRQYSLRRSLSPAYKWWEAIDIPPRKLTFLVPNTWLTLCPLICEDLAQLEPISDLIRGVGPNLVIAILMDGPQLANRWPARYAGVLADDPGSSILTLTSLGMAARCTARGKSESRAIASWKDPIDGWEQIELNRDCEAVVLSLQAEFLEEFTADGRSDGGVAAILRLDEVHGLQGSREVARGFREAASANNPPEVRTNEPQELRELMALSFLTDDIIDSPNHLIDEFRNKVAQRPGELPLIEGIKPFDDIWGRIEHVFRMQSGGWNPIEFQYMVRKLCDFMTPKNTKLNDYLVNPEDDEKRRAKKLEMAADPKQNMPRWRRIVQDARQELERLNDPAKAEADMGNDAGMARLRKARPAYSLDDYVRLNRAVYTSVIWAIHNRAVLAKNELEDRTKGRKQVEDLLHEIADSIASDRKLASAAR